MVEYRVQKGKLNGNYKDEIITENSSQAWAVYFNLVLDCGEKKRIQEMYLDNDMPPETLKQYSKYWTQGRGERA